MSYRIVIECASEKEARNLYEMLRIAMKVPGLPHPKIRLERKKDEVHRPTD